MATFYKINASVLLRCRTSATYYTKPRLQDLYTVKGSVLSNPFSGIFNNHDF